MGTTKSRKARRNDSRPVAFSFLSNISLGSETERQAKHSTAFQPLQDDLGLSSDGRSPGYGIDYGEYPDFIQSSAGRSAPSLHSTDSSLSADDEVPTSVRVGPTDRLPTTAPPVMMSVSAPAAVLAAPDHKKSWNYWNEADGKPKQSSEYEDGDVHHQLTRDDSDRPIASEKIKKKSYRANKESKSNGLGILSVLRYYTDKIRHPAGRKADPVMNRGYIQQQSSNQDTSNRGLLETYGHFLTASGSLKNDMENVEQGDYSPHFLENPLYDQAVINAQTLTGQQMKPSDIKRELNDQFRMAHPELSPEITLSKVKAIKAHLLEIGREVDLEVSSVAHAYVYFEKLVIKNIVTKKNRKLIAACCLLLAIKINEAKEPWEHHLLDVMEDKLDVDPEQLHKHEFAVFADLEFNLYIPKREFMPHFEQIFKTLEHKSMEDYLGPSHFYEGERSV
ncbi:hypothetical protein CLU79DRAFT_778488 [Phycomyces nitens]|nr:hypothetical protein CLU79DRAFT_778488 [Phycomyces nitens]